MHEMTEALASLIVSYHIQGIVLLMYGRRVAANKARLPQKTRDAKTRTILHSDNRTILLQPFIYLLVH